MELTKDALLGADRRSFLKGVGSASLGLAGAALLADKFAFNEDKVQAASYSDTDILNFALNLEYLEAEFYCMATYGTTLVKLGILTEAETTGPTTGGNTVPNFGSYPEADIATALRVDEIAHVKFLRAALGSAAAPKPAINLNALGYGFANLKSWLELARQFEDVGVSAYLGGAPYLANNATYLAAAAAILATEAQHAGTVRWACIHNAVISPAVDSLDVPPTPQHVYDVDAHALSIARTPSQVLDIVYHGGSCSGGFYPNGMSGSITCKS